MKRRKFITLLGGAAAWPLVARAQQAAMPVIAVLWLGGPSDPNIPPISAAFRQGLAEAGYVPDRNVAFELRRADFTSFLPRLAAELVDRKPAFPLVPKVRTARLGRAILVR